MSIIPTIENTGIVEQKDQLERILSTNPEFAERIRSITRSVMQRAAAEGRRYLQGQIPGSTRKSYMAVRYAVYKRILGGNVNILNRRNGAVQMVAFNPPRTLVPGQRGGNRIPRSQRTDDLNGYYGKDRGFILRFLNNGTQPRRSSHGNRGSIAPRNFFVNAVNMDRAAEWLSTMIDEEIQKSLNDY